MNVDKLYGVNIALFDFAIKWKELGLALGLSNSSLDIIEKDYGGDSQRWLTETLAKWLNGEGQPCTWRNAVKAALSLSKTKSKHFCCSIEGINFLFMNLVINMLAFLASFIVTLELLYLILLHIEK